MLIEIKFLSQYKMLIRTNDVILLSFLKERLTSIEEVKYRNPYTKRLSVTEKSIKNFLKSDKHSIIVDAGLIEFIQFFLYELRTNGSDITVKADLPNFKSISIPEKWDNVFLNHPRGFGHMQSEDIREIIKYYGGIVEVFTGYGKTELIACLCDIITEKIVVLTPDNAVMNEVSLRLSRYCIDHGVYDWNKRINVINPTGFINSKRLDDLSKTWLSTVDTVICDEVHHIQNSSHEKLFSYLKSVNRSYGFSASPDTEDGRVLSPFYTDIRDISSKSLKVAGLTGIVRVKRKLPIDVELIRVVVPIVEEKASLKTESWQSAFDLTVSHPKLARVIKAVIDNHHDRTFFIPIHKIESGLKLFSNLTNLGLHGLFWSSDNVKSSISSDTNINSELEYVKQEMLNKSYRFLMSTRFEGIDIPNLNAHMPLVGSNYRMVIQPAGRSARSSSLLIVLIYDTNNPITLSQSKKRASRIESEFNIVKTSTMRM